ncbi:MAG: sulfite exporter TauE/SafE family protein [bacterium]
MIVLIIALSALSFMLSASVGLGGSLILVPALSLFLGPKQGIALAAILLGCNNIAKTNAYRRTIPFRAVIWILLLTIIGAAIGAKLLVAAPESWVNYAIVVSIGATFLLECSGRRKQKLRHATGAALAFGAGATSGFSGTSGPLKGIALRNLELDRLHYVGAASVVSLAGDIMKAVMFTQASLMSQTSWLIVLGALPLMPLAALAGRHLNSRIGERAYARVFWSVMMGYSIRLLLF